jgi:hypothetical protein
MCRLLRRGGVVDHLKDIDAKKDVAIQFPMNVFGYGVDDGRCFAYTQVHFTVHDLDSVLEMPIHPVEVLRNKCFERKEILVGR